MAWIQQEDSQPQPSPAGLFFIFQTKQGSHSVVPLCVIFIVMPQAAMREREKASPLLLLNKAPERAAMFKSGHPEHLM